MFKIRPPAECMANWSSFNRFDEPHVLETTCQINFKPSRWDTGLMRFRIRTCLTDTTVSDNYYDLLNPVSINSFNVLKSFQFVSEADLMIRLYLNRPNTNCLGLPRLSRRPQWLPAPQNTSDRRSIKLRSGFSVNQSPQSVCRCTATKWELLAFHFKAFISVQDCWKTETTACWKRFYSKRFSRYFWRRTLLATHWWFSSL